MATTIRTSDPRRIEVGQEYAALNSAGLTYSQIASRYGVTRGQVSNDIALFRREVEKEAKRFEVTSLGTPMRARCDNALVVGDVHVPCTDYEFSKLAMLVARKQNVKTLIVAGDTFNVDSFSKYQAVVPAPTWAQERDAARVLFAEWTDWFDDIYVIMGNHDRRIQKVTAG